MIHVQHLSLEKTKLVPAPVHGGWMRHEVTTPEDHVGAQYLGLSAVTLSSHLRCWVTLQSGFSETMVLLTSLFYWL